MNMVIAHKVTSEATLVAKILKQMFSWVWQPSDLLDHQAWYFPNSAKFTVLRMKRWWNWNIYHEYGLTHGLSISYIIPRRGLMLSFQINVAVVRYQDMKAYRQVTEYFCV